MRIMDGGRGPGNEDAGGLDSWYACDNPPREARVAICTECDARRRCGQGAAYGPEIVYRRLSTSMVKNRNEWSVRSPSPLGKM
jgi:hypothetical protein